MEKKADWKNLEGFRFRGSAFDGLLGFRFRLGNGFAEDAFKRINLILDVVAELEGWDHTFLDLDDIACSRVAGRSCLAGLAGECAEAANFNGVAFDKLLGEQVEKLFDDNFDIVAHKSCGLGDFLNKVLFCNISHALNIGLSMT